MNFVKGSSYLEDIIKVTADTKEEAKTLIVRTAFSKYGTGNISIRSIKAI